MTLKRIISVIMASLMAFAFIGCTAAVHNDPGKPADATSAPVAQKDADRYLNAAGEVKPIAVYAAFAPDSGFAYDARYAALNYDFAARFAEAITHDDKSWSGVYSPLSLQIALQLLANGGDEATCEKLLGSVCSGMTKDDVNRSTARLIAMLGSTRGVSVNNAVVVNKDCRINADFAELAGKYYNAALGALDFKDPKSAAAQINGWVKEHTNGMIEELLDGLAPDTVAVLLNALALELDWDKPFTAYREQTDFNGVDGVQKVTMLRRSDEFLYGKFDEGEMAVVPYSGDEYRMAVILPSEGVSPADAVKAMLGRWNDCSEKKGTVIMPQVKLDTQLDVMSMIEPLGIKDAIGGNYGRLFEQDTDAAVSGIVQGASLMVTESGTTAAAATAITLVKGIQIDEFTLDCSRPYAMVIYNVETGTVLFVSIVNSL